MGIMDIVRMGHPALARPAEAVKDPKTPEIRQLVADMLETMADADGIGLAAPQVGVGLKVVIFTVPKARAVKKSSESSSKSIDTAPETSPETGESGPDSLNGPNGLEPPYDGAVPLTVLINPVITPLSEEMAGGWEACLSLPGLSGWVPRYTHIRYTGVDLDGQPIEREATGFHARVVQHECDHLQGILYPWRMTDLSRFGYTDELMGKPPTPDIKDGKEDGMEDDIEDKGTKT